MARLAPKVILVLAAGALLWWLFFSDSSGGDEPGATESVVKNAFATPVEASVKEIELEGQPDGPVQPRAVPASLAMGSAEATPGGDPAASSNPAGERAISAWHRALPADRARVAATVDPDMQRDLAVFADLWGANPEGARDRLRGGRPTSLGPAFERLTAALAEGGLEGLSAALGREPERGAAWLAWQEYLGDQGVAEQRFDLAGKALGSALRGMLDAGYSRERVLELKPAIDQVGGHASDVLPFRDYEVTSGDTLRGICVNQRKAGVNVWFGWIKLFNRRGDSNVIRVGQKLKIPTTKLHTEVWREARLLAVFAGNLPIRLYPVSAGKQAEPTPLGEFTINMHESEPVWWRDTGTAVPFGNPENPLGTRWLGFEEQSQYGIHGTNNEASIGSFETQGCVRMHNAEVEELYDLLPNGTKVLIHS